MKFTSTVNHFGDSEILINNQKIPLKYGMLNLDLLKFYPDNPRIYSAICAGDQEPDQQEIFNYLKSQQHVKELKTQIEENGGLVEPIIVRDGKFDVLEGNSRLAAYKLLAKGSNEAEKWSEIRCHILPQDIDERAIFSLLGKYHIKGKTKWAKYEQAGFLYRRHIKQDIEIDRVAKEVGLGAPTARRLVETFEFMINHNEEDKYKFSYYEEYLKSREIVNKRKEFPVLDELVVKHVRTGKIERAEHLRDMLPEICKKKEVFRKYLNEDMDLYTAYDFLEDNGHLHDLMKKLKKINAWTADMDIDDIRAAPINSHNEIKRNIRQIKNKMETLYKQLSKLIETT